MSIICTGHIDFLALCFLLTDENTARLYDTSQRILMKENSTMSPYELDNLENARRSDT